MNKPLFATFLTIIFLCLNALALTAALTPAAQVAFVMAVVAIVACGIALVTETGDTQIVLFAP